MHVPSGENETEWSQPSCPLRTSPTCCPIVTSHTLIVLSTEPDTICVPSGENETERTQSSCPLRTSPTCCPPAASHTLIVLSRDPDTMCVPSGENAIAITGDIPSITRVSEGGHTMSMSPDTVIKL